MKIFNKIFFSALLLLSITNTKLPCAEPSRIAILGESFTSQNEFSGINEEVLSRLFTLIRKESPSAVIFTGNMTLGLQRGKGSSPPPPANKFIKENSNKYLDAIDTSQWPQEGYSYDSLSFQKAIARFIAIKDETLGSSIPFYPVIADHEAYGPDSIETVRTAFKTLSQVPPFVSPLAYTFDLNKSLFVVFSIPQYSDNSASSIPSPLLIKWLEDTLKEKRNQYDFVFVVGNEPAFSTTATTTYYQGMDTKLSRRDLFWRILVDNRVTAYFCSKEHLYDRTNREGVWQIISGGAGAPFYKREFDKAFYHFLLLTIPNKQKQLPRIQVFDVQGNLEDEFELIPSQYPVYQLRISYLSN